MRIVFTKLANKRLAEVAAYLYRQKCSKSFVVSYIKGFKDCLKRILLEFPEAGTPVPQYGKGVRRIICQEYTFLYQVIKNRIDILTVFKENLPD